jgi:hypothetical protein
MNGEPSVLAAPRDHTGDALCAAYHSAEQTHQWARDNVSDAKRNLELAKLAEERAGDNAHAASLALRAHSPALHERMQWLLSRAI